MEIRNQSWESIDKSEFLKNFWQKKPLFIKGAFPTDFSKFSGDHLAGLSLEPESKSRLIQEKPRWSSLDGPFTSEFYEELPETHWTLLVQEVEQWVDEVYEFRENFDFIPRWRAHDIMVSYASDQGGVAAHTDHFDVFLIQTHGKRKWRLESGPSPDDSSFPDLPIRILKTFTPKFEIISEPGDLLYIPPEWAHEGFAVGEAMTWSVGFRSPSMGEASEKFLELAPNQSDLNIDPSEKIRLRDSLLNPREDAFLINDQDLDCLKELLSIEFNDRKILAQTLGELTSESFRDDDSIKTFYSANISTDASIEEMKKNINEKLHIKKPWVPDTSLRCFYFKGPKRVDLFVNGRTFFFESKELDLISDFCKSKIYNLETLKALTQSESGLKLLSFLLEEELIS